MAPKNDQVQRAKQEMDSTPVRILHVVGAMNRGGVETWLMHVLRRIDRVRFPMDFLVHTCQPAAYDNEIQALGSRIIPCPNPHQPLIYAYRLKRVLQEYGPYDVLHSHVHHYSGWVLRAAHDTGVPMRIAHSHSDTSPLSDQARILRRVYLNLMRRWILRYATQGLACSKSAASALFGPRWEKDERWRVVYCGIDVTPFKKAVDRASVRAQLGITPDAVVLGHVGGLREPKNQDFLIDVAVEALRRESRVRLLLIGEGPLRQRLERKAATFDILDKVIFAGLREDVPRLMKGAMDVFIMPSLFEGLPLAAIEAQAAGLPIIFSDSITPEVEIVQPLVQRLPLSRGPREWAELALRLTKGTVEASSRSLSLIETSAFNINNGIAALMKLYG